MNSRARVIALITALSMLGTASGYLKAPPDRASLLPDWQTS